MAINTLVTIKDSITAFAVGHGQLQGRVIFESDDHRSAYITEENTYPLLFVAPIDVQPTRAMNVHTLRVYVYERINDDRLDVWENANDTSLILRDIRVWWNDYGVDDINIVEDPIGQFGCDKELDNLVGYFADIRFEIPSHGRCQVPIDVTPSPTPSCADATQVIEDSLGNQLYSNAIPSGVTETQVIQNSTAVLKDTLGATISTTSILSEASEDIIAPNSTYLVEYVNGTDIQSGSIVSGGSVTVQVPNPIVCSDTTIEVNGTIEGTVAAGSIVNVTTNVVPTSSTLVGNVLDLQFPVSVIDSDAQAFLTATAIVDVTITIAVDTLVQDLKTANLWEKLFAIYPYVGGTATTHKFNLKAPIDDKSAYSLLFSGGIIHDANGVTFNGTNGQALPRITGVSANYGIGVYIGTNTGNTGTDIYLDAGIHIYPTFSGLAYHRGIGASPDNYVNTDSRGLFHQYGKPANSSAYKNSIKKLNGGVGATSLSTIVFGSGAGFSNKRHQFAFVGTSLTDVQAVDLYNIIQAFQTTLSRQV